jgi:hypothetical protein
MIRDLVGSTSAAVDAQVIADLTTLGWVKPLTVGLGASKDWTFNASPSVIWVPTRDRMDAPHLPARVPASVANNASLQSVHTRWAGVEARIWAVYSDQPSPPSTEDYSATEVLLNVVVMGVRKILGAGYKLGDGYWEEAQGRGKGSEDMTLGRAYVQPFWFAVPIYDAAGIATQKTLTALPVTRQVKNPDGSTENDPPSPQ